jgi:hypothetical protein
MAWNIHGAVLRGEIDNTTPGITLGRIWLIHENEPLELELVGDCRRDLAGTLLRFENPSADATLPAPTLARPQTGVVGDMTASLKRKIHTGSAWNAPHTWQNLLSLEWFDPVNGRVIIESPDFLLQISEFHWRQSAEADALQSRRNLDAMRDYVATLLKRDKRDELWRKEDADEFEWERRFQESDRYADVYQEVAEKYMDDFDDFTKQAYVMGMMVSLEDAGNDEFDDFSDPEMEDSAMEVEVSELDWLDATSDDEITQASWDKIESHSLQRSAHQLAIEAMTHFGMLDNQAASDLCGHLLQVASKLAGALMSMEDEDMETGFVLASLKRCLHWQNQALNACRILQSEELSEEQALALGKIRNTIFEIRDQITELRREFKQN